jgi:hypothetical protein
MRAGNFSDQFSLIEAVKLFRFSSAAKTTAGIKE